MFFFFITTAPTVIYTLSLHDALPISPGRFMGQAAVAARRPASAPLESQAWWRRSEEHTSELQSRRELVCRLLLEKKNALPGSEHGRSFDRGGRPPPAEERACTAHSWS